MAKSANALMHGDPYRRFKDNLARLFVSVGGVLVMFTLGLIFFYIAYVVLPLFKSPSVSIEKQFNLPLSGAPVHIGFDESHQIGFRYCDEGYLTLFSLKEPGNVISRTAVVENPTSFFSLSPLAGASAFGLPDGSVQFQTLDFIAPDLHINPLMAVSPDFKKKDVLWLAQAPPIQNASKNLAPLIKKAAVTSLSFSIQKKRRVVAGVTGETLVIVWENTSGQTPKETARAQRPNMKGAKVLVSQSGQTLFVLRALRLDVYSLSSNTLTHLETKEFDSKSGLVPESMRFFGGGRSLFVRFENGELGQWFDVVENHQRKMVMARTFNVQGGFLAIETHRNVFASLTQQGVLSLWHATSQTRDLFDFPSLKTKVNAMAFSEDATRLLIEQKGTWSVLGVENPYPDVSVRSLWKKIWYEGYAKPDYVWQSSVSDVSFEGKSSLVPLVFGSIKVAAYSLFFAIPLALGGAIYTAYFMPARLRKVVKPVIEIMEALPTVILGFLAAMWLAPIMDKHLFALGVIFVFMPFLFLLTGLMWGKIPCRWRTKMPAGVHLYILFPLILMFCYGAFKLAPFIEIHLFGMQARVFLTDVLGINFDQRNAIVVGLAMGFAVIPTIFTIAEDAIFSVPRHLTNGSLALGATYWQTLTRVVLLTASPGIFSAVMMGLGRALGETMIVLMAMGNTPLMDWNPFEGVRTLSTNIAVEMPGSEVGGSHYRILFLTAFVLFIFTFIFNTVAEFVRQRLREKYRGL